MKPEQAEPVFGITGEKLNYAISHPNDTHAIYEMLCEIRSRGPIRLHKDPLAKECIGRFDECASDDGCECVAYCIMAANNVRMIRSDERKIVLDIISKATEISELNEVIKSLRSGELQKKIIEQCVYWGIKNGKSVCSLLIPEPDLYVELTGAIRADERKKALNILREEFCKINDTRACPETCENILHCCDVEKCGLCILDKAAVSLNFGNRTCKNCLHPTCMQRTTSSNAWKVCENRVDIEESLKNTLENIPNDLRTNGWAVAIHNDYRLNGEQHTFWLFANKDGRYLKGEGKTDAEALNQIRKSLRGGMRKP